MPENESLHWTEDDDLLSEYVLGRIALDDVKRLEAHLAACPPCREAVRRERALASGIRRHGREELKARLGTMVSDRNLTVKRLLTWQRAVSAAAVIVIVVGIGILNGWFRMSQRGVFSPQTGQQPAGANAAARIADSTDEKKVPVPVLSERPEAERVQKESQTGMGASGEVKADRIEKPKQIVAPELSQGIGAKEKDAGVADNRGQALSDVRESDKMHGASKLKAAAQEMWGEGGPVPSSQSFGGQPTAAGKFLSRREAPAQQQQGGIDFKSAASVKKTAAAQYVEFRQSRVDLLPSVRQRVAEEEPSLVQTLFQRTGQGTEITLYHDTLFSEDELRSASVTRVGPDSIVIDVKSKRLGYRLPQSFLDSILGSWKKE